MKAIWIIPIFALLVCSGCGQYKTNQVSHQATPKGTAYNNIKTSQTPDLLDGPEGAIRNPHPLSLADLHAKYKSTFLLSGPSSKREVALTFDDVPDDKFTPRVLDILKSEGVKATFFLIGNRVEAHPEIVQRMINEGHVVGNHSYNHANLPKLSDVDFRNQVVKTDNIIRSISGYTPKFIRPPYGNISETQIQWLASQHKTIVNWNVDSLDWKGLNAEQVKTNVLAHVHPGSIILQHAAGGAGEDLTGSVQALPEIIKKLRHDGVKLVTIPELLNLPAGT
ncbi:polysaccharide deacetylase family protein [Paenibacillus sp. MZ04-78.2]|uniref:polysaccharide deacetylase family protein n=1 Tax=Paenibacillus sp. MZ04-78.2 TaxID=2962034 RepID=UPI0020B8568C|nr:polysaccharide deacetylase family protein [Paenibacillus sp. MZ04-78.2]MCP3775510.1 polysaccharide deacetylase family protein [Paenibacillus sp. MZ04-78.2]